MEERVVQPRPRAIRRIKLPPKAIDMMGGDLRIVDDISTRGLLLIDIARINPELAQAMGKEWVVVAMPAEVMG